MDFALTDEQAGLVAAVETLLERHAGPARARAVLADGGFDAELMAALAGGGFLDPAAAGAGPLEAVLVTEAVARHAGCVPAAARALVAPAVLGPDLPDVVALVPPGPRALSRFAAYADVLLLAAAAVPAADARITPIASMFGYPLAAVDTAAEVGQPVDAEALDRWWRVALAAEMVGTMEAALALTVDHLAQRRQFGQPIGAFQAIQHRLAELHIGVESARWMTRFAAARGAYPEAAAAAAASASMVADAIVRDTHQLSGAMGLTEEYDLYLWTMRLPALSLELGGAGGHETALARARWIDAATPDAPASAPEEAR
ncbi:acyl-CoA dehydrogenase family protein [Capillimicrobium parvum]|uniref:Acyl-CoA dehydrogenase/oxidase C-terminal domain-containing protein n=1 Tax=Capillimicrobium parvum TaxID=2884022 RepID=A0A9E7BZY8_9ACTN|nr:acyl-CoA dehydrogenase family protein [Capillimicrobium parvum]UGS34828.1 hypothetical protein DSM104329_01210 [Capillimicrobium parvum]